MKVHIALSDEVRADPAAKQAALENISNTVTLADINTRRFDRHGIISADLAPEDIPKVESLEVVRSVSKDTVQSAIR